MLSNSALAGRLKKLSSRRCVWSQTWAWVLTRLSPSTCFSLRRLHNNNKTGCLWWQITELRALSGMQNNNSNFEPNELGGTINLQSRILRMDILDFPFHVMFGGLIRGADSPRMKRRYRVTELDMTDVEASSGHPGIGLIYQIIQDLPWPNLGEKLRFLEIQMHS